MTASLPDAVDLERARLTLTVDGPVATITLSCPERRNAQTPRMWRTLAQIGASLPGEVRVVVVKGAGASFSAGLDVGLLTGDVPPGEESVSDLMHRSDQEVLDTIDDYQRGFTWLRNPRFVSI